MANQKVSAPALTQERFDMFASLAISLNDRIAEMETALKRKRSHKSEPTVKSLEEAYQFVEMVHEVDSLKTELKDLAVSMADNGVPIQIWFIIQPVDEEDKKKGPEVRLKLAPIQNNKDHPFNLKIER